MCVGGGGGVETERETEREWRKAPPPDGNRLVWRKVLWPHLLAVGRTDGICLLDFGEIPDSKSITLIVQCSLCLQFLGNTEVEAPKGTEVVKDAVRKLKVKLLLMLSCTLREGGTTGFRT